MEEVLYSWVECMNRHVGVIFIPIMMAIILDRTIDYCFFKKQRDEREKYRKDYMKYISTLTKTRLELEKKLVQEITTIAQIMKKKEKPGAFLFGEKDKFAFDLPKDKPSIFGKTKKPDFSKSVLNQNVNFLH